ncbi:MAG: N-acetylmuramoyl-L-alanine amidase [Clostridiales bacterium]|jgi:peptidoglycan hydrolase-like protein with peptidoglycan-binding domain|nr:N-acetylmuramoyl-L-alanine amidase [Clostridiales bacterium]
MAYVLKQKLCPFGLSNNPNGYMDTISYITIHNTGNYASYANAANHADYLYRGSDGQATSWHYTVDASEVWQSFEDSRMCWHTANTTGNRNSIGVEICTNDRINFPKACDNAARLTADLLKRHGLSLNAVVQHNVWSGKDCPYEIRAGEWGVNWARFLNLTGMYYSGAASPGQNYPSYPGYLIGLGSAGDYVLSLQNYLNDIAGYYPSIPALTADGEFGPATQRAVIEFQRLFELTTDGIVGRSTWEKIVSVHSSLNSGGAGETPGADYPPYPGYPLNVGSSGEYVLIMQNYLNAIAREHPSIPILTADGKFGQATRQAVIEFQRLFGLTADGVIGRNTWDKIISVYSMLNSGNENKPPEMNYPAYPGYLIRVGASGEYVEIIQSYLNAISRYYPSIPGLTADGQFGPATQRAVMEFQRLFGLTADGIIGQNTWDTIVSAYSGFQGYAGTAAYTGRASAAYAPVNQIADPAAGTGYSQDTLWLLLLLLIC